MEGKNERGTTILYAFVFFPFLDRLVRDVGLRKQKKMNLIKFLKNVGDLGTPVAVRVAEACGDGNEGGYRWKTERLYVP